MRRILTAVILSALFLTASAQSTPDYRKLYESMVSRVGYAGVGVETLLRNWAKADTSLSVELQLARFRFHFEKSRRDSVTVHEKPRFLGREPLLALKDSTGKDIYYYQETFYDPTEFKLALSDLDMAIASDDTRQDLKFLMADALIQYDKEKTTLSLPYLLDLAEKNHSDESFADYIQTYCFAFYSKGSAEGYEAFRTLSEKMLKYDRNNVNFIDNLGTYNLIVKKNDKAALKYYNKAVKIKPDDSVALQNIKLIERRKAAAAKK